MALWGGCSEAYNQHQRHDAQIRDLRSCVFLRSTRQTVQPDSPGGVKTSMINEVDADKADQTEYRSVFFTRREYVQFSP